MPLPLPRLTPLVAAAPFLAVAASAQPADKPGAGQEPPKKMRVVPLESARPEDPAKINAPYKAELLKLMGADQAIRKRAEALGIIDGLPMPMVFSQEWHEVDKANL